MLPITAEVSPNLLRALAQFLIAPENPDGLPKTTGHIAPAKSQNGPLSSCVFRSTWRVGGFSEPFENRRYVHHHEMRGNVAWLTPSYFP
jgi:hypothetical protein